MNKAKNWMLRICGSILTFVVCVLLIRSFAYIIEFLAGIDVAVMARLGAFYVAYIVVLIAAIVGLIFFVSQKRTKARVVGIIGLVLLSPLALSMVAHLVIYVYSGIG